MRKFFIFLVLNCFLSSVVMAETREFSSIEEAQASAAANAARRNKELLQNKRPAMKLPRTNEELKEYIIKNKDTLDISTLPKGDRLDKISAFSKVDYVDPESKKSTWEKIYDKAMERIKGDDSSLPNEDDAVYYQSTVNEEQDIADVPLISIKLPDGAYMEVPAYEHIPFHDTQIEVVPNRMLKVLERIVVVANGKKVKNPLYKIINKQNILSRDKFEIILDGVVVNGTPVEYKLMDIGGYYIISPVKEINLPEGVYVFEFKYIVDRYLSENKDFYDFYWDLNGGYWNLLTTRGVISVRMPGREPAVARYALTGNLGKLSDTNSVVMDDKINNISGYTNLYPLLPGESMFLFLVMPKVDFLPVTLSQKINTYFYNYGDIVFCGIYFLIVLVSSGLSWLFIRNKMALKNVKITSPMLLRTLWCKTTDIKSVGCLLLDLYRKNLVEIEAKDKNVFLVKKTSHSKRAQKFEQKILKILFSNKSNICKMLSLEKVEKIKNIVVNEVAKQMKHLALKLSSMYILFNVVFLLLIEFALFAWSMNYRLLYLFILMDVILLIFMSFVIFVNKSIWKDICSYIFLAMFVVMTFWMLLLFNINWIAITTLFTAIGIAFVFNKSILGFNAMLKNAIYSVHELRKFLIEQKEVVNGKNFIIQQANIFALDIEDMFPNGDKIKNHYRLDLLKQLLMKIDV